LAPENGYADVFIPISIQTERAGHYTSADGQPRAFAAARSKAPAVRDAADVFAALAKVSAEAT
jgi:NADH-quinone oxidoreductase subunit G